MERHVVVEAFARQLLDALGVLRREVGPQLDHDAALGRLDDDRILLVQIGGQGLLRQRGKSEQDGDNEGESADHGNSGSGERTGRICAKRRVSRKIWP